MVRIVDGQSAERVALDTAVAQIVKIKLLGTVK